MLNETSSLWVIALSILFFPLFFQEAFLSFAWGANDDIAIMILKRIFILLPAGAVVLACWMTSFSLLTVIVRQDRRDFVTALLVTWWDLGKAIFGFWGGVFKFLMYLSQSLFGFSRLMVSGAVLFISDL